MKQVLNLQFRNTKKTCIDIYIISFCQVACDVESITRKFDESQIDQETSNRQIYQIPPPPLFLIAFLHLHLSLAGTDFGNNLNL